MQLSFTISIFALASAIGFLATIEGFALSANPRMTQKNLLKLVGGGYGQQWRIPIATERDTTSLNMSDGGSSSSSSSSSKEEEIAKLEQQLRQLKEEAEQEEAVEEDSSQVATTPTDPADFVGRGPAKRPVKPMEEMMSESWKEEDVEGSGGGLGTVASIAAGLAFVAFLACFSQVPVGQEDLGKYQAIKTSTSIDLGDMNPSRVSD